MQRRTLLFDSQTDADDLTACSNPSMMDLALRCKNQADALRNFFCGDFVQTLGRQGFERMRHDKQRQVGVTQRTRRGFGQTDEFFGDDGDRRYATLLQFNCVMDTPRRTAASGG